MRACVSLERVLDQPNRAPDVACMAASHVSRCDRRFWDGADLVIEVLNASNRKLDLEIKRREYARARIPEYWIVDPVARTITVLAIDLGSDGVYPDATVFADGDTVASQVLDGFSVSATELLDSE